MNCTKIKRIIDEADRPDVFPLEAAGHIAGCPDCQSFADERAKLRELTGSVARVTAPSNFNVLLNERLSRVKSQRSSWLSPAAFLRLGTATAGLLVMFMVLQYGGFLATKGPTVDQQSASLPGGPPNDEPKVVIPETEPKHVVSEHQDARVAERLAGTQRQGTKTNAGSTSRTPRETSPDGPPLLLVRDNNGDRTFPLIPVSIGMQQQMQNANASYGRQQPRSSDISY
jgi:hypothetical protein